MSVPRGVLQVLTHANVGTHDIDALDRLERADAQSHDAYLCEARLRHFGAQRQQMQSRESFSVSTQDDN